MLKQETKQKIFEQVMQWAEQVYQNDTVYSLKNSIRFDYAVATIKHKISEFAFEVYWNEEDEEITVDEVDEIFQMVKDAAA